MAKVLISIEISKPYAYWKNVFDNIESERQKVGIKKIYVGHEAGNEKMLYTFRGSKSRSSKKIYV